MVMNSGPVAMAVLVLLLIASLYSWTVILGKVSSLGKATRESRRFIRGFRKANRLQEIATLAAECKASPLAQVFEDVYETYKRQTGGAGPPRNLAPLERSAQTAASAAGAAAGEGAGAPGAGARAAGELAGGRRPLVGGLGQGCRVGGPLPGAAH